MSVGVLFCLPKHTVWGGFMLFVRHACFWRGKNGEIIWRRTILISYFAVTVLFCKTSKIKKRNFGKKRQGFFM